MLQKRHDRVGSGEPEVSSQPHDIRVGSVGLSVGKPCNGILDRQTMSLGDLHAVRRQTPENVFGGDRTIRRLLPLEWRTAARGFRDTAEGRPPAEIPGRGS